MSPAVALVLDYVVDKIADRLEKRLAAFIKTQTKFTEIEIEGQALKEELRLAKTTEEKEAIRDKIVSRFTANF